jgi:hypothetical protein
MQDFGRHSQRKKNTNKTRRIRKDNIKIDLKELKGGLKWIHLATASD